MSSQDRRLARIADVRENLRILSAELHLTVDEAETLQDLEDILDRYEEELDAPATPPDAAFEILNADDLESGDRFRLAESGELEIDRPSERLLETVASISVPVDRPEKVLLETTNGRARYVSASRWVWRRREES